MPDPADRSRRRRDEDLAPPHRNGSTAAKGSGNSAFPAARQPRHSNDRYYGDVTQRVEVMRREQKWSSTRNVFEPEAEAIMISRRTISRLLARNSIEPAAVHRPQQGPQPGAATNRRC